MYWTSYKSKTISSEYDLILFADHYKTLSGLSVDLHYLREAQVIGIYLKNKLIGGFVLSSKKTQLRTIKSFIEQQKQALFFKQNIADIDCVEICCLWLQQSVRNYFYRSLFLWLCITKYLYYSTSTLLLFGTNSKGLARLYALPPNSTLVAKGLINGQHTYVFLGKRQFIVSSVLYILHHRFYSPIKKYIQWQPPYLQIMHT